MPPARNTCQGRRQNIFAEPASRPILAVAFESNLHAYPNTRQGNRATVNCNNPPRHRRHRFHRAAPASAVRAPPSGSFRSARLRHACVALPSGRLSTVPDSPPFEARLSPTSPHRKAPELADTCRRPRHASSPIPQPGTTDVPTLPDLAMPRSVPTPPIRRTKAWARLLCEFDSTYIASVRPPSIPPTSTRL